MCYPIKLWLYILGCCPAWRWRFTPVKYFVAFMCFMSPSSSFIMTKIVQFPCSYLRKPSPQYDAPIRTMSSRCTLNFLPHVVFYVYFCCFVWLKHLLPYVYLVPYFPGSVFVKDPGAEITCGKDKFLMKKMTTNMESHKTPEENRGWNFGEWAESWEPTEWPIEKASSEWQKVRHSNNEELDYQTWQVSNLERVAAVRGGSMGKLREGD